MPQLTIRHADGSTDTIAQTTRTEIKREIGRMRRGRFTVERSLASAANLEAKSDVIELPNDDNLRLVDVETGGSTWVLVGYSFEWDANAVPPTVGGALREGTDSGLLTDFVNSVPSWSAGTINQQSTGLSFVFNHAAPHEAIRRIEMNVPGEIQFRDEGVVDYTSRLGTDRSGSVELSASTGTLEQEIQITERGRKFDGTHIRVLGAHEGEAQPFANLVPDGDPQTYENEVRYSTSRWSSSDDTEWDRVKNSDLTDQPTVEQEATELGEELQESFVEAKATVSDVDLNVGDTVQVVKSDANLDRSMRVHRLTEIVEGAVEKAKVLLSTRTALRTDEADDLKDIQRMNTGYQGASVYNTVGPIEQNVDSNEPLELEFYYPDIAFENVVNLNINSLPYKYYVSPTSHDHGFSVPDHDHRVEIDTTPTSNPVIQSKGAQASATGGTEPDVTLEDSPAYLLDSFSVPDDGWPYLITASVGIDRGQSASFANVGLEAHHAPTGDIFQLRRPTNAPSSNFTTASGSAIVSRPLSGDTLELRILADVTNQPTDITYSFAVFAIPPHKHTVDINTATISDAGGAVSKTTQTQAGVDIGVESTNETASNADVTVNGTTVATDIGSGEFNQTVNLKDELNQDAVNRVEITTDSPGRYFASIDLDGYKKIGAN